MVSAASKPLPVVGFGPDIPPFSEPWPEQQAVENFLETLRPTLERLHTVAASNEPVWFPRDSEEFIIDTDLVQSMRVAARISRLEYELAARRGDPERANRALHSVVGIALALRAEPSLIGHLITIALYGVAVSSVQDAVETGQLDAEQCDAMAARLKLFDDYAPSVQRAVAGERAYSLPLFAEPSKLFDDDGLGFLDEIPFAGAIRRMGPRPIDALIFLDWTEPFGNIPESDLDALRAFVQARQQAMDDSASSAGVLQEYDMALTMWTTSNWSAYGEAVIRQVMRNRLALLGLAVRQFQGEHGRWPEDLEELQAVGVDASGLMPLGGRPFGYRIEAGEAVLWGFNPQGALDAVPPEPPPIVNPGDEFWVWRLR